ncbi:MAG: hypothetical protein ACI8YQ_002318 [Polaribacter sp.]
MLFEKRIQKIKGYGWMDGWKEVIYPGRFSSVGYIEIIYCKMIKCMYNVLMNEIWHMFFCVWTILAISLKTGKGLMKRGLMEER